MFATFKPHCSEIVHHTSCSRLGDSFLCVVLCAHGETGEMEQQEAPCIRTSIARKRNEL
eukprot:TRINITY_DN6160_c0_g1_i1.p2 TRINITY_DN6160_c0_g1~~TRINITY_DN6160_c0_g1_i1.p2  ORF type:complete len:59 (+),score=10.68 TRINITY_DN6160_c0_g1_i1:287-463(+)